MTTATTNVIAKIAAAVAGLGLVAMTFAPAANAQSNSELEAQIAALLAQIAALQAQVGGSTGASASVTFTRDLTIGSTGADVTALQNWLMSKGHTIAAGATGYFGAQTQAALAAYQASASISPAAGYFGPITRAHVNAMGGGSTGGSTGGDDNDDNDGLSGGESSLESLEAHDGEDDDVDQGTSGQVAEFEFDVEDGDIRIDRLDLTVDSSAVDSGDDDEPWDVFDSITIMNEDGDELASEDVSDEDDWLDDDGTDGEYVFRFTGLDYVVREGDTGMLMVEVEANNGSDFDEGAGSGQATWELYIDTDGLRGVDGEGIQQYLGDATENVTFDVVEEGSDDELTVRSSTEDPDSATLQVEDDGRSDWHTIFAFDLDADEDSSDVEINEIGVNLTTSDSDIDTVVNDLMLVIDGEEFDDYDSIGTTTTFDIDGDLTVDSGDRVTVEVMAEFKSLTNNYTEATTIQASTTGSLIDAEGADDITVTGSATGDTHTLRSTGIAVDVVDTTDTTSTIDGSDNDYATFEVEVDVEAFEQDVYISATSSAFTYQIEDADGDAVGTSTATSSTVSSSAETESNGSSTWYRVDEGSSETFTFRVTFNPLAANESADYRMQLLTIIFGSALGEADQTYTATPSSDFETDYTFIAD